jgi:hypothetical protein
MFKLAEKDITPFAKEMVSSLSEKELGQFFDAFENMLGQYKYWENKEANEKCAKYILKDPNTGQQVGQDYNTPEEAEKARQEHELQGKNYGVELTY